jgi:hypothetical protein
MATLNTAPNLGQPDDFYAELLALHEGRSREESERVNARLILLLANYIGDRQVLREAMAAAAATSSRAEEREAGARAVPPPGSRMTPTVSPE